MASEEETSALNAPRQHPGEALELALLERVAGRDHRAFERLYLLYYPRLDRFLHQVTQQPALIEEVVNETMLAVWAQADRFRGASKLSTWIFGIAYNQAMRALAKAGSQAAPNDAVEQTACEAPAPDGEAGRSRVQRLLFAAIGQLAPAQRAVVDLTYYHGMGYREIAAILDCPVDTVKTRMFHARRKLKARLGGQMSDWL